VNPDPDREKQLKFLLFFIIFFHRKLQFHYPFASIKGVQDTGEAFSSQKRTSSTLKDEICKFPLLDPDLDCESGSGYGSREPIESGSYPY
jgi:hypothetical protein